MDEKTQKQSVVARLKEANNILVTVSADPSVDQLAACMGLTLALNKYDKHGTAVFSGRIPSTIDFLKPDDTLEKNTDSLRDFIISLDKSKADKLRYKVEENVVKIFITPYRTSISDKDLVFSQGDFNVDVVIALGVHDQQDIDQAITSHGRILHDATVVTLNVAGGSELGALNWVDDKASSLSEMVVSLVDAIDDKLIDNQIATALLTGIVAETERFSNEKTTPATMSLSAQLMSAGADQQLVAAELTQPVESVSDVAEDPPETTDEVESEKHPDSVLKDDGSLEITHDQSEQLEKFEDSTTDDEDKAITTNGIDVDDHGNLILPGLPEAQQLNNDMPSPQVEPDSPAKFVNEPPVFGGNLTANVQPEGVEPDLDSLLSAQPRQPLLSRAPSTPPAMPAPFDPLTAIPADDLIAPDPFIVKPNPAADTEAPKPSFWDSHASDTDTPKIIAHQKKEMNVEQTQDPLGYEAMDSEPIVTNPQPSSDAAEVLVPEVGELQSESSLETSQQLTAEQPIQVTPPSGQTLAEMEETLHSPHVTQQQEAPSAAEVTNTLNTNVDSARDAVSAAIDAATLPPQPVESLNALPLSSPPEFVVAQPQIDTGLQLPGLSSDTPQAGPVLPDTMPTYSPSEQPMTMPLPTPSDMPPIFPPVQTPQDPNAPPPVPPPMTMPPNMFPPRQ